jgi:hypothetical protein
VPHFRVDDALHSHPKAQRAGDAAMGMWVRAGSFCMAYLTDGFVPNWWVKQQKNGTKNARLLVSSGLWHDGAEQDGERGYLFHEWLGPGRQDSKAQIEADREKWRQKKQRQRETTDPMSPGDTKGDTTGDSPGASRESPGYTQPNPTHRDNSPTEEHSPNVGGDERGLSAPVTPSASRLVSVLIPSTIPDSVRAGLRIQASQLMNGDGLDGDTMAETLRRWLAKPGAGVGLLPSIAADVIRERAAPAANGRPHKLRALANLTAEVRAAEQAQLETDQQRAIE